MTSATSLRPPPSKPIELELTILSAKHLKNVNWCNGGDIKPYVVFWLDSDRRLSTKPDQSGSTKPVWNETFTLPINLPLHEALLSLEILHSKPSETPNPLIGSVRIHLNDVVDGNGTLVRKFELRRPSGRPQGKIFIKSNISERDFADYAPPNPYYYSTAAPPPPSLARDYRQYPPPPYTSPFLPPPSPAPAPAPYYRGYSEPYPGYYSGYYQQPPHVRPPYYDRQSSFGGPSAPFDYAGYDQKQRGSGKLEVRSGVPVEAAAAAMGGLALDEGVKYDEDKPCADRVESDLASRDGYTHYRPAY